MQWDVKLIPPFHYSNLGGWLLLIGIIIIGLVVLCSFILKKIKEDERKEKPIDISNVKRIYLSRIDALYQNVNNQQITERKAYHELSKIIREFIFKVTKIDVLKYTLADAKSVGNQQLIMLLSEYYEPEFSKEGKGNLNTSIENTRKVIQEWK